MFARGFLVNKSLAGSVAAGASPTIAEKSMSSSSSSSSPSSLSTPPGTLPPPPPNVKRSRLAARGSSATAAAAAAEPAAKAAATMTGSSTQAKLSSKTASKKKSTTAATSTMSALTAPFRKSKKASAPATTPTTPTTPTTTTAPATTSKSSQSHHGHVHQGAEEPHRCTDCIFCQAEEEDRALLESIDGDHADIDEDDEYTSVDDGDFEDGRDASDEDKEACDSDGSMHYCADCGGQKPHDFPPPDQLEQEWMNAIYDGISNRDEFGCIRAKIGPFNYDDFLKAFSHIAHSVAASEKTANGNAKNAHAAPIPFPEFLKAFAAVCNGDPPENDAEAGPPPLVFRWMNDSGEECCPDHPPPPVSFSLPKPPGNPRKKTSASTSATKTTSAAATPPPATKGKSVSSKTSTTSSSKPAPSAPPPPKSATAGPPPSKPSTAKTMVTEPDEIKRKLGTCFAKMVQYVDELDVEKLFSKEVIQKAEEERAKAKQEREKAEAALKKSTDRPVKAPVSQLKKRQAAAACEKPPSLLASGKSGASIVLDGVLASMASFCLLTMEQNRFAATNYVITKKQKEPGKIRLFFLDAPPQKQRQPAVVTREFDQTCKLADVNAALYNRITYCDPYSSALNGAVAILMHKYIKDKSFEFRGIRLMDYGFCQGTVTGVDRYQFVFKWKGLPRSQWEISKQSTTHLVIYLEYSDGNVEYIDFTGRQYGIDDEIPAFTTTGLKESVPCARYNKRGRLASVPSFQFTEWPNTRVPSWSLELILRKLVRADYFEEREKRNKRTKPAAVPLPPLPMIIHPVPSPTPPAPGGDGEEDDVCMELSPAIPFEMVEQYWWMIAEAKMESQRMQLPQQQQQSQR